MLSNPAPFDAAETAILFYTTWPDPAVAAASGRALVEAGLAACVNIGTPMTAIYRWNGAIESAIETPMLVKTWSDRAEAVRAALLTGHPYDNPAILAFEASAAKSSADYLAWLRQS